MGWAISDQAMVSGVNFLTGILTARVLGVAEFGVYSLCWMVVLFAGSMQHALVLSPMMSIGPKLPQSDRARYFGTVLTHQIVLAGICFLVVFFGVVASSGLIAAGRARELALPLAVVVLAHQMQDFQRRNFFALQHGRAAVIVDGARYGVQFAGLVWIYWEARPETTHILWIVAAAAIFSVVIGWGWMARPWWDLAAFRDVGRRHWHFSKWVLASTLMQWTSGNFLVVVAGAILGAGAVGAIKAAQNILGLTHVLFHGMENVVPVRASQVFQDRGRGALSAYIGKVALWGGVVTGLIVLAVFVSPEYWLHLVYGDEYRGYGGVLRWYALIYLALFFSLPLIAALRAMEYTRPHFVANLVTSLITLSVSYPLVRFLGVQGVAAGFFFLQVIILAILGYGMFRRLEAE